MKKCLVLIKLLICRNYFTSAGGNVRYFRRGGAAVVCAAGGRAGQERGHPRERPTEAGDRHHGPGARPHQGTSRQGYPERGGKTLDQGSQSESE